MNSYRRLLEWTDLKQLDAAAQSCRFTVKKKAAFTHNWRKTSRWTLTSIWTLAGRLSPEQFDMSPWLCILLNVDVEPSAFDKTLEHDFVKTCRCLDKELLYVVLIKNILYIVLLQGMHFSDSFKFKHNFPKTIKKSVSSFSSSLWRLLIPYNCCVVRRLPVNAYWIFPLHLSDGEDSYKHGLHRAVVQRVGGEPQRAVGNARMVRVKVEQVGAVPHRLWAGWKERENKDWQ